MKFQPSLHDWLEILSLLRFGYASQENQKAGTRNPRWPPRARSGLRWGHVRPEFTRRQEALIR